MQKHRILWPLLMAALVMLFSACGERKPQESVTHYDILSKKEECFPATESGSESIIGMQFFRGEPVKLVRVQRYEDGVVWRDIYLCGADGSRRALLTDLTVHITDGFLDRDGSFYSVQLAESGQAAGAGTENFRYDLSKWDEEGRRLFQVTLESYFFFRGQLQSGELILNLAGQRLMLLNPETGELSEIGAEASAAYDKALFVLGARGNSLLVMDIKKLWEIDAFTGEETLLFTCEGTTFELSELAGEISDCRVSGEGEVSFLYEGTKGEGILETLAREDIGQGKIPVTFRGMHFTASRVGLWLKERILDFNSSNETYFVILEECPEGTAEEDYARMTSVEIAAKKGPDLLMGSVLEEYILGMTQKGALEDLSRLLKKSGIREEDFFPGTFSCYREGEAVYGVVPTLWVNGYMIDGEALGLVRTPDAAELAKALLACEEPNLRYWTEHSDGIVRQLLCGSEDLWGMIDWKAGTCDFRRELFYDILEAAKRCGFSLPAGMDYIDETWLREEHTLAVEANFCWNLYSYRNQTEMEEDGMVPFGTPFDDGCFATLNDNYVIMINSRGKQKDGAWEFLRFLLSEEAQEAGRDYNSGYPAGRAAFEKLLQRERAEGPKKSHFTAGDGKALTSQDGEELRKLLEEARFPCFRTQEILDIICEEARGYFDGTKTVEQAAETAENRVRLYLSEHR